VSEGALDADKVQQCPSPSPNIICTPAYSNLEQWIHCCGPGLLGPKWQWFPIWGYTSTSGVHWHNP